ncbi:MAG: helix-turn-helix transcriptional regulator [Verrucomicrobia bacterium]|nr:helix-turn-helix transcriptional regulator [Verrucomicrobiota bacterium]
MTAAIKISTQGKEPKAPSAPEYAPVRWFDYSPRCRQYSFNQNPALNEYMEKRGIRWAGVDDLHLQFEAGTSCSETHLIWLPFTGRMECDVGMGYQPLNSGDLAVCPARHPHRLRLASASATGLWIHFHHTQQWKRFLPVKPGVYPGLPLGHLQGLVYSYILKENDLSKNGIGGCLHAMELILLSIDQALDDITEAKSSDFKTKVSTLEARIQATLQADWTVARLARELHMSTSNLHKTMLRHYGIKPADLITRLRINHAISRLLNTDMTLADIAEETGYSSAFAFSSAFKRKVGRSPKYFRVDNLGP